MAKKKDKKLFSAAHIKRHTEGTSNEISFSVLDAAKNKADVEEGKDDKALTPFGKITIWSWRPGKKPPPTPSRDEALSLSSSAAASARTAKSKGSASPDTFSPDISAAPTQLPKGGQTSFSTNLSQDVEISRRKGKRRLHRALYALLTTVLIALLASGGYYLYTELENHQIKTSLLDQALDKIDESDKTVIAMDKAINNLSDTENSEIEAILNETSAASLLLTDAYNLSQESQVDMRDSVEKSAAEEAGTAAKARQEMLVNGEPILRAELAARSEKESIAQAWSAVLHADELAREAAEMVTETTTENVEKSREKTAEAIAQFEEGLYLLNELSTATMFALDMQPLNEYVSKRIESMNHAIASDDAILNQEREKAQSENEAYNTTEEEASVMAKDLPDEVTSIVSDAHKVYIKEYEESYLKVRQTASTADAFLRDYLGT